MSREVRITLIGKTGDGKSSVGNTILDKNRFTTGSGCSSVTRRCQKESAVTAERKVTVVDTPDFFHSTHEEDLISEIKKSVTLSSPGVHAFLYVLKPTVFTKQEEEIVSQFKQTYGEEVFRHTIVLFTHGDQLQRIRIDKLISQNESLRNLVTLSGGRYTVLNNKTPADREQVSYLLETIDRLSNNGKSFYTLEMLQEAQSRAEAQQRRYEDRASVEHQVNLERAKRETEIHVRKEMEEERKRLIEEAAKNSTTGVNDVDKVEQENAVKRWFVYRQKYFYVIAVFSLSMGCMFRADSADRWIFLFGCGLGGSAASLGVITGKGWVLMWRSQFRMSCSSPQQHRNVYQYLKKVFGVVCGGLVGSLVGFCFSDKIPVTLLAALAGATGAYTAMHKG